MVCSLFINRVCTTMTNILMTKNISEAKLLYGKLFLKYPVLGFPLNNETNYNYNY